MSMSNDVRGKVVRGYLHLIIVSLLGTMVMVTFGFAQGSQPEVQDPLMPSETKMGECYAQVFVPAVFETREVKKLRREASQRFEVIPTQYEESEQTILVQEPTERIEVIPAVYEWVEEQVLVKPASTRIEVVQPEFEPVIDQVVVRPAHSVWKMGQGPMQRIDHATGQIMCLLEQPATHKKLTKYVLKKPGSTKTIEMPAEYTTVRKRVVRTPATIHTVKVPAQYKIIKVARQVAPAEARQVAVPAEYQTVVQQVQVTEGRVEWQPVLCETNVSASIIESLQRSLLRAGYDPRKVDGRLGKQTMVAVEAYQRDKGLPVGNLTIETLSSLGVQAGQVAADDGKR